jgi:hypothetical protein
VRSERLISSEGDALQLAVLREVVAHGVVLGGPVVPHGQGVGLPAQAGRTSGFVISPGRGLKQDI